MSIRSIAVLLLVGCGSDSAPPPVVDAAIDAPALCDFDQDCTCTADDECVSGACLGDSRCADASRVLYVSRDVTGTTCTLDDKCTLPTALGLVTSTKDIVHLDPLGYVFPTGFTLASNMHILGRDATVAVDAGIAFNIMGGRAVTLDLLGLGGTTTAMPTDGVGCTNATLTARGVTIALTAGIGINASGCTLTVERSTLHDNLGGAMLIGGGGVFDLSNNFMFRNGNVTNGSCGGVQLLGSVPAGSSLEFNTIVDNHASNGGGNAGGVICNAAFSAPNNIIARNDINGNTTNAQTQGACTYDTSRVQDDVIGLAFVSPDTSPFNYKIGAGSTAIDFATTPSTIAVDHEGDPRPQGSDKDAGADELAP